jgi:bleomycin hydrolase
MSLAAYNYGVFVPSEKISKGDRLKARIDTANHAMAVTGYDPAAKGKGVLKWKIENSWGSKANDKGHLHMYDDFFRQYVEEVAIPRSLVPQDVLAKLESRPLAKKPMVEDK